jgi:NADPH:quinone reductase-like Zn-dependent oxidoreductase
VHSAGITPQELLWDDTYTNNMRRIPGRQFSGTVVEVPAGPGHSRTVGEEVIGLASRGWGYSGGAQCEHVITTETFLALKPEGLSHAEAAARVVPISIAHHIFGRRARTFVRNVRNPYESVMLQIQRESRILITGASGAVGSMLVQFANKANMLVMALVRRERYRFVSDLCKGRVALIDYNVEGWEKNLHDLDLVIDTVGGDVLDKCWGTLKRGGTLLMAADPTPDWAYDPRRAPSDVLNHLRSFHHGGDINIGVADANIGGVPWKDYLTDPSLQSLPVQQFPFEKAEEAWEFAHQRPKTHNAVINFVEDS